VADLNKFLTGGGKTVKLHEQRERIREASDAELDDILRDLENELLNLRTQAMLQQSSNPKRISHVRKLIARIYTIRGEKSRQTA